MKHQVTRALLFLSVVFVLIAMPTAIVLAKSPAQDSQPPAGTQTAGEVVLDVALMVAITAFLKTQFDITGKPVMAIAFGVGVVLWGAPLISAAFPAVGVYIDGFLAFIKVWLGAMGSVDLVQGVGRNIAAAKSTTKAKS
jgi:hypothetical protein